MARINDPGAKAKPKVARPKASPPPVTDVQSSGGNYGAPKATKFKQTRAYRGASRAGYTAGTPATKRAVLRNPKPSVERQVARVSHQHRQAGNQAALIRLAKSITPQDQTAPDVGHLTTSRLINLARGAKPPKPAQPKLSPSDIRAGLEGIGLAAKPKSTGGTGGLPLASINTVALSRAVSKAANALEPIAKNAAHDIVNTPVQVPLSVYKVAKDTITKGPATGAKELAQPYVQLAEHPLKTLKAHPVNTALMVYGPLKGLDRTAGSALEKVGVKTSGRTVRVMPHTGLAQVTHEKPGVVGAAVREAGKHRLARKVTRLNAKADTLETTAPDQAHALRAKAVSKTRMTDRQIAKRVDHLEHVNEQVRRAHQAQVVPTVRDIAKGHKGAGLSLVAQGIVKPTAEDLAAYRAELANTGKLTDAGTIANRTLRKAIKTTATRPREVAKLRSDAEAFRATVAPLEKGLIDRGIIPAEQADRAKLIPYAVRNMGARHNPQTGRIETPSGDVLSPAEIRAHMKANGVQEPSFLTQAPNRRGARNFYSHYGQPKGIGSATRTGEATRSGTFDANPHTLEEQAARAQGLIDTHDGFTRFVKQFGFRRRGGERITQFTTRRQADAAARELAAQPGLGEWRIVNMRPWGVHQAQVEDIVRGTADDATSTKTIQRVLDGALHGEGDGPFALVPAPAADRLLAHTKVLGGGGAGKSVRLYTGAFRKTVLSTSPSWLTGNVAEAALRTAVERAGPRSYLTGRKLLKQIPEEAQASGLPGGHFTMASRAPRTSAEQFMTPETAPFVKTAARAIGALRESPGGRTAAGAWHAWTHFVFDQVNNRVERQFQTAMMGKYARTNLMDGRLLKTGEKAIQQAAQGLRDTNEQAALANYIHDAYGRYSGFSPGRRRMIALYTPFAAWLISAANFVFHVLPRDHPALTALAADMTQATQEWRKQHGLDKYVKGAVPGFLQGSIPTSHGGHVIFRYTPFAAFTSPDNAVSAVLPQFSDVSAALKGQTFTGKELRNKDGSAYTDDQRLEAAGLALLQESVPVLSTAQRVAKSGPGVLNPVRVTKAKKKAAGKATSGVSLPSLPSLTLPKLPGG